MSGRRRSVSPPRSRWVWLAAGLVGAVFLFGTVLRWRVPWPAGPRLVHRIVRIRGREITVAQVKAVLRPDWRAGWIGFPINRAVRRLKRMPWVAHAAIRRVWPDTLIITVREQRPVARWDREALVNARGRLFYRGPIPKRFRRLPELSGASGSLPAFVKMELTCARRLNGAGEGLHSLAENRRGGFRLRLAGGPELRLGRKRSRALRHLDRFLEVVRPALGPRLNRVAYVDLRYVNGFAVGWLHSTVTEMH